MLKRLYNLPQWSDPFDDLARWRQLFGTLDDSGMGTDRPHAGVFPLLNVSVTPDRYLVRAELPGIKADELDITVSGNNLTISGERKILEENKTAKYHRREREAGKFNRALTLPGPLDSSKVDARLKDGILTLVIPRAEEAKPKKIIIQ